MKNTRVIYFCDVDDDNIQETQSIQRYLTSVVGLDVCVEMTTLPPFEEKFDILFFDWGGMSVGNSMMDYFCRNIIECAENNPGRIFIMTSAMTEYAMMEALHELKNKPNNIYLSIEKAKIPLMCFKE